MNSLEYNTDIGYGMRLRRTADEERPNGYIVQVHFYDMRRASEYMDSLIRAAFEVSNPIPASRATACRHQISGVCSLCAGVDNRGVV